MSILCCIPARYHSTRLEGKPLLKINNKTVINLVYEKVKKVKLISEIVILTDDERIKKEVINFGGKCEIITEYCLNGTDRIIKYLKNNKIYNYDIILNVQGDEPFINPEHIEIVLNKYIEKKKNNKSLVCETLYHKTNNEEEIKSRSRGKLVLNKANDIIYCSRNIIPATKKKYFDPNLIYNLHIGVFVFDYKYLMNNYVKENTNLQLLEDIEWLKIIEQGYTINAVEVEDTERGVDTIDDYKYLLSKYSN